MIWFWIIVAVYFLGMVPTWRFIRSIECNPPSQAEVDARVTSVTLWPIIMVLFGLAWLSGVVRAVVRHLRT